LTEGQNVRALLATSDRTLAVRVGEEIDGQWRVEQIDSDSLVLTWRPAHLRQTIVFKPVQ
jgi:Tfp pilus assembly protein PilP